MTATKHDAEQAQLDALYAALPGEPGLTAWQLDPYAPMTTTLRLLNLLEKSGKAAYEPDPKGNRWYRTTPPPTAPHDRT